MPFKTDGSREYRSFFGSFSTVGDTGYIVEGYATTFDEPYDFGADGWKEQVLHSALNNADMSDVIFQLNHEGQTLARLRNKTLELRIDEHGLYVKADLGGSQAGRDLYEAIKNGLIDRMSWGFALAEDGYQYDSETKLATISKVIKVFDVSAVSIPADQDTEIHARSYLDGVIEKELLEQQQRDLAKRQAAKRRLALKAKALSI
ncbi:MAG: HK97 family phage prohead protease [Atopobium minutum]|uniref:HK97 family phage prohead protease n=1 Tax=Atopobium TaxID=1380 RepID=UPI0003AE6F4D|nr:MULTISPECIES: HK97 family phage prohead protease [Atopobium]ERL15959.1 phage prohead protease, HK97 family [Atopobium sp. BV3Ac4]MDU4969469.1 HK97 family phage prohead protease [Atopobium minutum]MDU5356795.1 HK97 family phage prohead protease [Atopobium minutum]MDU5893018.1 HK97 family phage prohead protease [Atopobium minutum]